MAHLLGSQSNIDSLRRDVLDIHVAIESAVSSNGPVKVASWKYPDKLASELNTLELLNDYTYNAQEPEDNQVSHIVMYELVIDRLVYLLQLASNLVSQNLEQSLLDASFQSIASNPNARVPSMSTGLVAKKLWSRLSALCKSHSEKSAQLSDTACNVEALEEALEKVTLDYLEVTKTARDVNELPEKPLPSTNAHTLSNPALEEYTVSRKQRDNADLKSSACQTLETSFLACNNCSVSQRGVIMGCESLGLVCQSLGLRSLTSKYLKTRDTNLVATGVLSVQELNKLCSEQTKDLNGVAKRCSDADSRCESLSHEIDNLKEQLDNMNEQVKSYGQLMESERSQHQKRVQNLGDQIDSLRSDSEQKLEILKCDLNAMRKTEVTLRKQVHEVSSHNDKFGEEIQDLRQGTDKLEAQVSELNDKLETAESELDRKRQELEENRTATETLRDEKDALAHVLEKERVKSKVTSSKGGEMQSKQDNLVARLEELDEECERLREQVNELEIERDDTKEALLFAQEQLQPLQTEISRQNAVIQRLEAENQSMQERMSEVEGLRKEMANLKERNDMLILFPDLTQVETPPVTKIPAGLSENDPRYLQYEMQQQITSNELRIDKLNALNSSLKQSLSKIGSLFPQGMAENKNTPNSSYENTTTAPNPPKLQTSSEGSQSHSLKAPIPLWHSAQKDNYLAELPSKPTTQREDSKVTKKSSGHLHAASSSKVSYRHMTMPDSVENTGSRSASHLESTAAKARALTSSGRFSKVAYSCSNCGRLFKSSQEVQAHSNSCPR